MASSSGYTDCIEDARSLVPINMMCLGAAVHFLLCLAIFWQCGRGRYESTSITNFNQYDTELLQNKTQNDDDNSEIYTNDDDDDDDSKCQCNNVCIKIIKYLIAIIFFLCAATQTVLDYMQYMKSSKDINNGSWKTYQCSVFLFTNSPNALHAVAAIFSFGTAVILHRFDKSARFALIIFVCGEIFVGILITPFCASIFTHLIAGLFVYGWIAIFIFAGSILIFWKMNTRSLEHRGTSYSLFIGVFISMLLMVLLIVVTNNTQIKLYDGTAYIQSLKLTLTERKTKEYFQSLQTFDQWFTFIWLIL